MRLEVQVPTVQLAHKVELEPPVHRVARVAQAPLATLVLEVPLEALAPLVLMVLVVRLVS